MLEGLYVHAYTTTFVTGTCWLMVRCYATRKDSQLRQALFLAKWSIQASNSYSDICAGSVACCYVPCEFVSCMGPSVGLACLHRVADNINPVNHGVNFPRLLSATSPQTWEQTCRVLPTTRVRSMDDLSPGSTNEPKMIKRVV